MHEMIVRFAGSEADVMDAFAQMQARMINAMVAGIGTPGVRTSYARVEQDGELVAMLYVDEFGIVRTGEYIAPDPYPLFIHPTGGHDSYPVLRLDGDPTRVMFNGEAWQNTAGQVNSWVPGSPGTESLWQRVADL